MQSRNECPSIVYLPFMYYFSLQASLVFAKTIIQVSSEKDVLLFCC